MFLPLPALQIAAKPGRFDHDTLKWWQNWKRITNQTAKNHVLHAMTIDSILFYTILCVSFIFGFYLCFVSLHTIPCYLFHINKHLYLLLIFSLSSLRKTFIFPFLTVFQHLCEFIQFDAYYCFRFALQFVQIVRKQIDSSFISYIKMEHTFRWMGSSKRTLAFLIVDI